MSEFQGRVSQTPYQALIKLEKKNMRDVLPFIWGSKVGKTKFVTENNL